MGAAHVKEVQVASPRRTIALAGIGLAFAGGGAAFAATRGDSPTPATPAPAATAPAARPPAAEELRDSTEARSVRARFSVGRTAKAALAFAIRRSGLALAIRHSVARSRVSVLSYHDPSPELLERHLAYLARHYRFLTL